MAWEARWEDPESVGWLVRERVRCGKANCRCARDPQARHGPYVYHYWREYDADGEARLRKRYVRRQEVARRDSSTRTAAARSAASRSSSPW